MGKKIKTKQLLPVSTWLASIDDDEIRELSLRRYKEYIKPIILLEKQTMFLHGFRIHKDLRSVKPSKVKTLREALLQAFPWENTKEGSTFWRKVSNGEVPRKGGDKVRFTLGKSIVVIEYNSNFIKLRAKINRTRDKAVELSLSKSYLGVKRGRKLY